MSHFGKNEDAFADVNGLEADVVHEEGLLQVDNFLRQWFSTFVFMRHLSLISEQFVCTFRNDLRCIFE